MGKIRTSKDDLKADFDMISNNQLKYLTLLISFCVFVFWKAFDYKAGTNVPMCGNDPCFAKAIIFNTASFVVFLLTIVVIHLNIPKKSKMKLSKAFFFTGMVYTTVTFTFFTAHIFKALNIPNELILKDVIFAVVALAILFGVTFIRHRKD